MGFFSRGPARRPPYLSATPADLRRLGELAFGGESPYPPGVNAFPPGELDGYAMHFLKVAGYPPMDSPQGRQAQGQFLDELEAAAASAGAWAYVGAIFVGWNALTGSFLEDPRYRRVADRGLDTLRRDGVSYTAIPPFALDCWTQAHGYEGSHPAGWPTALADLPIPNEDEAPPVKDLADGEARRLAQAPAAPANSIYAERRPDGTVQAVVEGVDPDTGVLRRWDWDGLSAPSYPAFLRELGERLVTHSYWAHDDLIPYFPCRRRSRDQMRVEAGAFQAGAR
ncbi:hypothetical protein C8N24_3696 [Solirubrobacter pauli]|uniref:Uncharacterized protein n=1 Tax=Solirubrobacter pauli TaxID=166793 RepID=A0A660LFF6_9ACTN|nr:hypothetical protein [Solirubrobacter pauli]RKQ93822.1 hypothetical protein C8N24_3696 [Solirubrobacter pauli]